MSLDRSWVGRELGPKEQPYNWRDVALYAMGLGAGPDDLGYLLEQDLFSYRRLQEVRKRLDLAAASHKHPATVTDYAADKLDMRDPSNRDQFVIPMGEPPYEPSEEYDPDTDGVSTDPGEDEP